MCFPDILHENSPISCRFVIHGVYSEGTSPEQYEKITNVDGDNVHDIQTETEGNKKDAISVKATEKTWFGDSSLKPCLFLLSYISALNNVLRLAL